MESTPFKLKPYLSPHVNTHLWLTSYHLDSLLFSFFWTVRYHVDESASDFTRCFLSFCFRLLVEALAASPVACLKPSINHFVFCTHGALFTFHLSEMFSEFQKEFFDHILLFPFWHCFPQLSFLLLLQLNISYCPYSKHMLFGCNALWSVEAQASLQIGLWVFFMDFPQNDCWTCFFYGLDPTLDYYFHTNTRK